MKKQGSRTFLIDNEFYRFDFQVFNKIFHDKATYFSDTEKRIGIGELERRVAEAVNETVSAVHNWRMCCNGPADLDIVRAIADVLGIKDWKLLLKKVEMDEMDHTSQEKNRNKYSDRQLQSIKRIYDAIIDYLNDFVQTDGFTGELWYEFAHKGIKDVEEALYAYVEKQINKVYAVVDKEYFDLHGLEIYEQLVKYAYNDLVETYDGKLGYAYRFEAIPEGNSTTEEDYSRALKKIKEIVGSVGNSSRF